MVVSKAVNLAPNVRPVALVKIQHAEKGTVAGQVDKGIRQPPRQVGPMVKIQVHGQKTQVGGHVAATEGFVEFDTVEDVDFIVGQTDVAHVQIAVAVADAVVGDPRFQQCDPVFDE